MSRRVKEDGGTSPPSRERRRLRTDGHRHKHRPDGDTDPVWGLVVCVFGVPADPSQSSDGAGVGVGVGVGVGADVGDGSLRHVTRPVVPSPQRSTAPGKTELSERLWPGNSSLPRPVPSSRTLW